MNSKRNKVWPANVHRRGIQSEQFVGHCPLANGNRIWWSRHSLIEKKQKIYHSRLVDSSEALQTIPQVVLAERQVTWEVKKIWLKILWLRRLRQVSIAFDFLLVHESPVEILEQFKPRNP